jgi:excisionase family DNA binding protein
LSKQKYTLAVNAAKHSVTLYLIWLFRTKQGKEENMPTTEYPNPKYTILNDYISIGEATAMLKVSRNTLSKYITEGKLRAWRMGGRVFLNSEEVRQLALLVRPVVGRPCTRTPPWRWCTSANQQQFVTTITVQLCPEQHEAFEERLVTLAQQKTHQFPGTVARYITQSQAQPEMVMTILERRAGAKILCTLGQKRC